LNRALQLQLQEARFLRTERMLRHPERASPVWFARVTAARVQALALIARLRRSR
jgi:hypothetical protein